MKSLIVDECQLETSSSNNKPYKMENADGIRASPGGSECPDGEKPTQVPEQTTVDDVDVERSDDRRSTRLNSRSSKRKYDEVAPIQDSREVDNRSGDASARPDSPSIRNQEAVDQSVDSARWKRPYELDSDHLQVSFI